MLDTMRCRRWQEEEESKAGGIHFDHGGSFRLSGGVVRTFPRVCARPDADSRSGRHFSYKSNGALLPAGRRGEDKNPSRPRPLGPIFVTTTNATSVSCAARAAGLVFLPGTVRGQKASTRCCSRATSRGGNRLCASSAARNKQLCVGTEAFAAAPSGIIQRQSSTKRQ